MYRLWFCYFTNGDPLVIDCFFCPTWWLRSTILFSYEFILSNCNKESMFKVIGNIILDRKSWVVYRNILVEHQMYVSFRQQIDNWNGHWCINMTALYICFYAFTQVDHDFTVTRDFNPYCCFHIDHVFPLWCSIWYPADYVELEWLCPPLIWCIGYWLGTFFF